MSRSLCHPHRAGGRALGRIHWAAEMRFKGQAKFNVAMTSLIPTALPVYGPEVCPQDLRAADLLRSTSCNDDIVVAFGSCHARTPLA
jgi:hypothetical protein